MPAHPFIVRGAAFKWQGICLAEGFARLEGALEFCLRGYVRTCVKYNL